MAIDMNGQGWVPTLRPCEACRGAADYFYTDARLIVARCTRCGRQTIGHSWARGAGEDWNRRASDGARLITLAEINDTEQGHADMLGWTAAWMEWRGREQLLAVLIQTGIDLGSVTASVKSAKGAAEWTPEAIAAEGVDWRLWDRMPTRREQEDAPWNGPAWEPARVQAVKGGGEA